MQQGLIHSMTRSKRAVQASFSPCKDRVSPFAVQYDDVQPSSFPHNAVSLHHRLPPSLPKKKKRKRVTHRTLSRPLLDSTTPDNTFNLSIVPSLDPMPSCTCVASFSFPFLEPCPDGIRRCRGLVGTVYAGSDDVLAWGSARHGSVSSAWVRLRDIVSDDG